MLRGKRLLSLLLCLVLLVSLFPFAALADDGEGSSALAEEQNEEPADGARTVAPAEGQEPTQEDEESISPIAEDPEEPKGETGLVDPEDSLDAPPAEINGSQLSPEAEGVCGDDLLWSWWDPDEYISGGHYSGDLEIEGTGEMYNYSAGASSSGKPPWAKLKVIRVTVYDGATSIGNGAFLGSPYLSTVTLPDSVVSIGDGAFYGSTVDHIVIGPNVTKIGNLAFADCTRLRTLGPNGYDNICVKWKSEIPYQAFVKSSLKTVTVPEGIKTIGGNAFMDCADLNKLTIPASVTSIGVGSFRNCSSLPSVNLPGVVTIDYDAFRGCTALTTVTLGDSVQRIGSDAFRDCPIASLTIPESVTTIEDRAFNCSTVGGTPSYIFLGSPSLGASMFPSSAVIEVKFLGGVPTFGYNTFKGASVRAYYPAGDPEWTEEVRQDYGGEVTWIPLENCNCIFFDANGGENAPKTQGKLQNETVTITKVRPTRQTETLAEYTVRLDPNGGECATEEMSAKTTRAYSFVNWSTTPDGSGKRYEPGAAYSANEDLQLYAQWQSADTAAQLTLPVPVREGCTFCGWAESPDAESGVQGSYYPTEDIVLYATWKVSTYTVSYYANGGSLAPARQIKTYGVDLKLTEELPVRPGFRFRGWATSMYSSSVSYQPGDIYSRNANLALYALWEVDADRSGQCGEKLYWCYQNSGLLVIYGSGDMYNYSTSKSSPWRWLTIKTIIVEQGASSIGNYAFDGTHAENISLPYTVKKIGDGAFEHCDMERIDLPTGASIGKYSFFYCQKLKEIQVPEQYGLDYAIDYCSALETVWLPATLKSVNSANFKNCPSLQNIYVAEGNPIYFDEDGVLCYTPEGYDIKAMTHYPAGRTGAYTIPEGITRIESAFNNCKGLTGVTIPASVTEIWEAFSGCTSLALIRFQGKAPYIWSNAFKSVTATAFYKHDSSWTSDKLQNYGGTITWIRGDGNLITYLVNGTGTAPKAQAKQTGRSILLTEELPVRDSRITGSFTVNLDACGGSLETGKLTADQRETYNFLNWNTAADGSGESYAPGASYAQNLDLTLYAQWETETAVDPVTLPAPTREGYRFLGWSEEPNASEASYQENDTLSPEGDLTLYALWKANEYPVSFDANGGETAPEAQSKIHDIPLTLTDAEPARAQQEQEPFTVSLEPMGGTVEPGTLYATRTESYHFLGWNTASDGSGESYAPGAEYAANESVTLYAQWESTAHTEAVSLPVPEREGYDFLGWAESSSERKGFTGAYTPENSAVLYALWREKTISGCLSLEEGRGTVGHEVSISLQLDRNPGLNRLSFTLDYDAEKLQLLGCEDGELTGWGYDAEAARFTWESESASDAVGAILKLRFWIPEDSPECSVTLDIEQIEARDELGRLYFDTESGTLAITNRVPGDTNSDGKVNGMDLIRLRKYLAGEKVEIDLSNADVTGDGKVNGMDLIRLRKYLAGENVELK